MYIYIYRYRYTYIYIYTCVHCVHVSISRPTRKSAGPRSWPPAWPRPSACTGPWQALGRAHGCRRPRRPHMLLRQCKLDYLAVPQTVKCGVLWKESRERAGVMGGTRLRAGGAGRAGGMWLWGPAAGWVVARAEVVAGRMAAGWVARGFELGARRPDGSEKSPEKKARFFFPFRQRFTRALGSRPRDSSSRGQETHWAEVGGKRWGRLPFGSKSVLLGHPHPPLPIHTVELPNKELSFK